MACAPPTWLDLPLILPLSHLERQKSAARPLLAHQFPHLLHGLRSVSKP
jgi:hypothetical protein